jgi:CBS domain-containing protein
MKAVKKAKRATRKAAKKPVRKAKASSRAVPAAGSVMTRKVITVNAWDGLDDLAETLAADGISGAPVIGTEGHLVGIVSRTDLLEYLADQASKRPRPAPGTTTEPEVLDVLEEEPQKEWEGDAGPTVADIMETEVVTVPPSMPVPDVARLMARHRIHRVVVVEKDAIKGIITSLDLLDRYPGAGKGKSR